MGATYALPPPAGGDVAEGVPTPPPPPPKLAFASFLSSLRFFLSSRAWADSTTSVFMFHYKRHSIDKVSVGGGEEKGEKEIAYPFQTLQADRERFPLCLLVERCYRYPLFWRDLHHGG